MFAFVCYLFVCMCVSVSTMGLSMTTHTHTQSVSSAPSGKHPHLPVLLSTNCLPLKKGPGQSEVPAVWCHLLLPACNWLISPAWKCPCVQTANKKKQEIKQQKTTYVYFIGGGGGSPGCSEHITASPVQWCVPEDVVMETSIFPEDGWVFCQCWDCFMCFT